MKKPAFITDDEWNTVFPNDRQQIVSIAASLFRKGYAKRESFFLAKEIFDAQTYGRLIRQNAADIFLKWVELGFNPSGTEIHQTILFGKLIKTIYNTSSNHFDEIQISESPLREAWKKAKWDFPSNYCLCCFERNNKDSIQKSGFLIHEACSDLFSKLTLDLAERIVFEINNSSHQAVDNTADQNRLSNIMVEFDADEDMNFIPSEPNKENKPDSTFLDIFK